jgi:hypothetical protein
LVTAFILSIMPCLHSLHNGIIGLQEESLTTPRGPTELVFEVNSRIDVWMCLHRESFTWSKA